MADRSQELAIIVRVQDLASRALKSVNRELGGLEKGAWGAGRAASRGIGAAIGNIERLAVAGAGLAVGGGLAAVKWAGDFEAGMNTINTVAMKSPAVLKAAGEGIRKIARDTGASLDDLQQAEYDLVSAGIALESAQAGLTQANRLSIGAIGSNAEAVDVLTTAINSYNLKAKDGTVTTATWAKVSDELAQAVADGKTTLSAIAGAYAEVAPVAAQAGIGTNEVAAALGFLTAKGNPAAETVTQMSRAIIELQKPTATLTKLQDKFHKNYAAIAADKGLNVALQEVRKDAEKAGVPFIELFGRIEGYKYALQTTGPNAAAFAAELDKINHSAGMTNKQFDERAQGFNYQLGRLKAAARDAGITIGTALLPKITPLIEKLSELVSTHQGDIAAFADGLAKAFESAVQWASKLDFKQIAADIRSVAGVAKSIVEAFLSAPPWLQEAVVTGWGLNKLTGGAVVDIGQALGKGVIGGLAGELAKGMFSRGGSPATPLFVADVTGGKGIPPLPGGGGGILPILGNVITKLGGLALVFGGLTALDAGTQAGGPGGAGIGALGAGATIAGAAFLAGPLGAMAASLGLVGKTLLDIRDTSKGQGDAIAGSIQSQIAGGAKLSDLKTSLAAVNTGIDQIESNPLMVLLAGDALDQLKAQRAALERQVMLQANVTPAAGNATPRTFTSQLSGKERDDIVDLAQLQKSSLLFLRDQFHEMLAHLKGAKTAEAIRSALKEVALNIFTRGKGGIGGTEATIAAVKKALESPAARHDPKLAAELRAELAHLERQLDYRRLVQEQLHKADRILHSNESAKQKLAALEAIQRSFNPKDLAAQAAIRRRIDAVKHSIDVLPSKINPILYVDERPGHNSGSTSKPKSGSGSSSTSSGGHTTKAYDTGAWSVPRTEDATVHQAEMILKPGDAQRVRAAIARPAGLMSAAGVRSVMVQIHTTINLAPKLTVGLRELQERQQAQVRLGKVTAG